MPSHAAAVCRGATRRVYYSDIRHDVRHLVGAMRDSVGGGASEELLIVLGDFRLAGYRGVGGNGDGAINTLESVEVVRFGFGARCRFAGSVWRSSAPNLSSANCSPRRPAVVRTGQQAADGPAGSRDDRTGLLDGGAP